MGDSGREQALEQLSEDDVLNMMKLTSTLAANTVAGDLAQAAGAKLADEAPTLASMAGQSANDFDFTNTSGQDSFSYTVKRVQAPFLKAGAIGFIAGIGLEAIFSYKRWRAGALSDREYLKEIFKSGADSGVTSGFTAAILAHAPAALAACGLSTTMMLPVGFVVSGLVNKVVAPCFARGAYRKYLREARYYENLEAAYRDMTQKVAESQAHLEAFLRQAVEQRREYDRLRAADAAADSELQKLLNEI